MSSQESKRGNKVKKNDTSGSNYRSIMISQPEMIDDRRGAEFNKTNRQRQQQHTGSDHDNTSAASLSTGSSDKKKRSSPPKEQQSFTADEIPAAAVVARYKELLRMQGMGMNEQNQPDHVHNNNNHRDKAKKAATRSTSHHDDEDSFLNAAGTVWEENKGEDEHDEEDEVRKETKRQKKYQQQPPLDIRDALANDSTARVLAALLQNVNPLNVQNRNHYGPLTGVLPGVSDDAAARALLAAELHLASSLPISHLQTQQHEQQQAAFAQLLCSALYQTTCTEGPDGTVVAYFKPRTGSATTAAAAAAVAAAGPNVKPSSQSQLNLGLPANDISLLVALAQIENQKQQEEDKQRLLQKLSHDQQQRLVLQQLLGNGLISADSLLARQTPSVLPPSGSSTSSAVAAALLNPNLMPLFLGGSNVNMPTHSDRQLTNLLAGLTALAETDQSQRRWQQQNNQNTYKRVERGDGTSLIDLTADDDEDDDSNVIATKTRDDSDSDDSSHDERESLVYVRKGSYSSQNDANNEVHHLADASDASNASPRKHIHPNTASDRVSDMSKNGIRSEPRKNIASLFGRRWDPLPSIAARRTSVSSVEDDSRSSKTIGSSDNKSDRKNYAPSGNDTNMNPYNQAGIVGVSDLDVVRHNRNLFAAAAKVGPKQQGSKNLASPPLPAHMALPMNRAPSTPSLNATSVDRGHVSLLAGFARTPHLLVETELDKSVIDNSGTNLSDHENAKDITTNSSGRTVFASNTNMTPTKAQVDDCSKNSRTVLTNRKRKESDREGTKKETKYKKHKTNDVGTIESPKTYQNNNSQSQEEKVRLISKLLVRETALPEDTSLYELSRQELEEISNTVRTVAMTQMGSRRNSGADADNDDVKDDETKQKQKHSISSLRESSVLVGNSKEIQSMRETQQARFQQKTFALHSAIDENQKILEKQEKIIRELSKQAQVAGSQPVEVGEQATQYAEELLNLQRLVREKEHLLLNDIRMRKHQVASLSLDDTRDVEISSNKDENQTTEPAHKKSEYDERLHEYRIIIKDLKHELIKEKARIETNLRAYMRGSVRSLNALRAEATSKASE